MGEGDDSTAGSRQRSGAGWGASPFAPRARSGNSTHAATHPPRVGHVLSGAKIRVTEADGSHEDYDEKTGDTYWADFSPLHDTRNIGATPYIALLVEVKDAPAKAK